MLSLSSSYYIKFQNLVFQGKCYGYCHFEFPSLTFLFFLCSVLIPLVFTVPLFLLIYLHQIVNRCSFASLCQSEWILDVFFKFRRSQAKLVNRELETGNSWNEEEPTSLLAKCHNWNRSLEASEEDLGEGGVVDQDASYVLQGHGVNHQQKKKVPIGDMGLGKGEPKKKWSS